MTTFDYNAFASACSKIDTSDITPAPRGLQPMTLVGVGQPIVSAKSQRENQQDPSKPLRYRVTLTFQNDDEETAYYYVTTDAPSLDPSNDGGPKFDTPVNMKNFLRYMGMKTNFDIKPILKEVASQAPENIEEFQSLFREETTNWLREFVGTKVVANVTAGKGDYAESTNVDKWSLVK